MSEASNLTFEGIRIINALVERCTFEEAHHNLGILKKHLESRIEQTRPDQELVLFPFSE